MAKKAKNGRRKPKALPSGVDEYSMRAEGGALKLVAKKETWRQKIERLEKDNEYLRKDREDCHAAMAFNQKEVELHRDYKNIIERILAR